MTTEATTIATEAVETLAAAETAAAESGLNIEKLKEMMDSLDPAGLLPQLDTEEFDVPVDLVLWA